MPFIVTVLLVEDVHVPFVVVKFPVTVHVPDPEVITGVELPPLVKDKFPVRLTVILFVLAARVAELDCDAPVMIFKLPLILYVPAAGVQVRTAATLLYISTSPPYVRAIRAVVGTLALVASNRTIELKVPVVPEGIPVVAPVKVIVPAPEIVPVELIFNTPGIVTVRPEPIDNVFESFTLSVPLTVSSLPPFGTVTVVPVMVKLLNVVATDPVRLAVPVMVTVPERAVKTPLFVQSPAKLML